jgi:FixJ family two-component response regulator
VYWIPDISLAHCIRASGTSTNGRERPSVLIAIVDDEAALRGATPNLLKSEGFKAESFASAEEFLRSDFCDQVICFIADIGLRA